MCILYFFIFFDVFILKKKELTANQPQAGPSEGILEESIVIGDDSCMCVAAPEDQWDKMWRWKRDTDDPDSV